MRALRRIVLLLVGLGGVLAVGLVSFKLLTPPAQHIAGLSVSDAQAAEDAAAFPDSYAIARERFRAACAAAHTGRDGIAAACLFQAPPMPI